MVTSTIGIPVELRSNEQTQLETMVPALAEYLEEAGLEEQYEEITTVQEALESWDGERESEAVARTLTLGPDEWRTLILNMDRLANDRFSTNRVEVLRNKLWRRVRDQVEEL